VVCGVNKPRFTKKFDFLIGGRKKKDATQKKLKISNLHKNNTQKTHTHTHTKPILLEIEPHTRGETNKA
jgi:hypothetical protein